MVFFSICVLISELVSVFICFITGTWYLTIPIITNISIIISIISIIIQLYSPSRGSVISISIIILLSFSDIVYFLCWRNKLHTQTTIS